MVSVGKHRKQGPARDDRDRHTGCGDGDDFDELDSLESLDSIDDGHKGIQHLLGAIHLTNPIRLQSPIYIESSQRSKAKSEEDSPRADEPLPEGESLREVGSLPEGESLREDTVIMEAIRERPTLDLDTDLDDLPPGALDDEWEQAQRETPNHQEHLHRLFGSMYF